MPQMKERHIPRIYLLSHMRAYSSLIGHILGSHPQINGYYEMHLSYTGPESLDEQVRLYRQSETLKAEGVYLFDKLLHNDYSLNTSLLSDIDDRLIVSLRAPGDSLKSILRLFQDKPVDDLYADPVHASDYYIQRLDVLARFCKENPKRYYYFDAELVLADSQTLLSRLTRWCGLSGALSDRYQTFRLTGKSGTGDSSELIRRGKIEMSGKDYPDIKLDTELLRRAEEAYVEARKVILSHARDSLCNS